MRRCFENGAPEALFLAALGAHVVLHKHIRAAHLRENIGQGLAAVESHAIAKVESIDERRAIGTLLAIANNRQGRVRSDPRHLRKCANGMHDPFHRTEPRHRQKSRSRAGMRRVGARVVGRGDPDVMDLDFLRRSTEFPQFATQKARAAEDQGRPFKRFAQPSHVGRPQRGGGSDVRPSHEKDKPCPRVEHVDELPRVPAKETVGEIDRPPPKLAAQAARDIRGQKSRSHLSAADPTDHGVAKTQERPSVFFGEEQRSDRKLVEVRAPAREHTDVRVVNAAQLIMEKMLGAMKTGFRVKSEPWSIAHHDQDPFQTSSRRRSVSRRAEISP